VYLLLQLIKNTDIVVGDVMQVDTGDKIIADGIMIDGHHLVVDEASLTGEWAHVAVTAHPPVPATELQVLARLMFAQAAVTIPQGSSNCHLVSSCRDLWCSFEEAPASQRALGTCCCRTHLSPSLSIH
jgi:P-type E1-E2 ATPase